MLDQAVVDYRKFKLYIDVTTEEHYSKDLIPILTISVNCIVTKRENQEKCY